MKPKKVLFLITKSNWGGAQRYVFDIATNLDPSHWEPVVALGGDGPLKAKLELAGIRVLSIPGLTRDISLKKELLASWRIAQLIRKEDPDVLHVNSSKAGAIGAGLGRVLAVPRVVFTAHAWAFNEDRSHTSKKIIAVIHWLTVLFSHHTITASTALKKELRGPWVQHKMTTIHHGLAPTTLVPRTDARAHLAKVTAGLSAASEDIWCMSIGELHPVKQHSVAITAIAQLIPDFPTLRYLIVGDGELRTALTQRIADAGVQEHVFLCGHVDEAAHYLAAADVFVFPSRSEALGYVALEAAQAGVPTVASNVGGIPEVVQGGTTGTLVPSGDVQALAAAIATYLRDATLRETHGAAGAAVANQYTIDRMLVATEVVYRGTD